MPAATCGGGFVAPKRTSYEVAPAAVHVIVVEAALRLVVLSAGDGEEGAAGGGPTTGSGPALTLSNVDVFSCVVSWLVTVSAPTGEAPKVTDVVPTCVHVVPSDEA